MAALSASLKETTMINPKQGLTQIRDIYVMKDNPGVLAAAMASGDFAAEMVTANVVHEYEAAQFATAQQQFSISTVEEVAELARRDEAEGSMFLQDAGLPRGAGQRLLQQFLNTPQGAEEVRDWERYDRFEYSFGCEIDLDTPPPLVQPQLGGPADAFAAPATPLLTNVSLIGPYMPPIRDQGARGTCVAFTSMACLEFYQHRFGSQAATDLSEQFIYWDMVTRMGQRNLISAYPLLTTSGSCQETTWPYVPNPLAGNDQQDPPPPLARSGAAAHKCGRVSQLPARDIDAIKSALTNERIVGIGIPVYKSWFDSAVVRKYGNVTVPLPGEVPQTIGHAVALVGFADDQQFAGGGFFIVRNSWGMNWATASPLGTGYGTIPYRYIANFNWDAWCIVA
jgi:hypothetical protein